MANAQSFNDAELRILHVDDDVDDRLFLAEALHVINFPHRLTGAGGCIDLFALMDQGNLYDLIFLDINMPMIDGKECLKKLKAHEKYCSIPVVIFTNTSSQKEIDTAYELGAHYHVVKPYASSNFVASLRQIMEIDWKSKPAVPSKDSFVINYAFI